MAVVRSVNEVDISKLTGILDYYMWLGLQCVRTQPRTMNQPGTLAQQQTWDALQSAKDDWRALLLSDKVASSFLTANIPRTGHDWYMKTYLQTFPRSPYNVPVPYNVQLKGIPPDLEITCETTKDALPWLAYGYSDKLLRSPFQKWNTITYFQRGARFRRKFRIRLLFPFCDPSLPGPPKKHHLWTIPEQPPGDMLSYMILSDPLPFEKSHIMSGLYRHT